MKAFFLLFISLVCLSSCKKVYTCECYTTFTQRLNSGNFFTEVIPGNKAPYSEKLSKKQATTACEHEQTSLQTNFINVMTDNGRYPLVPGESVSTSCILH